MKKNPFHILHINQSCRIVYQEGDTKHIFREKLTSFLANALVGWLNSLKGDRNEPS